MPDKKQTKKRSGLGASPLGLFSPTSDELEQSAPKQESSARTTRTRKSRGFLAGVEDGSKESIGLQVTTEVNDWLDRTVKKTRRKHGTKIPKQVIIQAGIELLRELVPDWSTITDVDALRAELQSLTAEKEQ